MLPNMEYKKKKRQYQVVDPHTGDVEEFPPGNMGRRKALHRAIYFQNPRLHDLVSSLIDRWPVIESRAWRAAMLVLNEAVEDATDGAILAKVTGNSEYGPYLIQSRDDLLTCDCLDYVDGGAPYLGSNGQRVCKHILAVQFRSRLQIRTCGMCGRKVNAEMMICPYCDGEVTPF